MKITVQESSDGYSSVAQFHIGKVCLGAVEFICTMGEEDGKAIELIEWPKHSPSLFKMLSSLCAVCDQPIDIRTARNDIRMHQVLRNAGFKLYKVTHDEQVFNPFWFRRVPNRKGQQ